MTKILQQLLALAVLALVAFILFNIGLALVVVFLVVGAIAALWLGIKFYFIRKELIKAVREHEDTRFYSEMRGKASSDNQVIEGEFVEVDETRKP